MFVRGRLFFELGDHDIIIVVIVDRVLKIGQLFTHFGGDILVFQRVLDVGSIPTLTEDFAASAATAEVLITAVIAIKKVERTIGFRIIEYDP